MGKSIDLKYICIIFFILIFLISACTPIPHEVGTSEGDIYGCESTGDVLNCLKLSGGRGTRCYVDNSAWYRQPFCEDGWMPYNEPLDKENAVESKNFIVVHDNIRYHCYESKDFCLPDGDISKERVPLDEVIG